MDSALSGAIAHTKAGFLSRAVTRLFMRHATVAANERLDDKFHRITLEGPALKDIEWTAGQKVQITMGSAFTTRTYTPVEWDADSGRAVILGYVHGGGPGSTWLQTAKPGHMCDMLGPRASVNARKLSGPVGLFGDETSIGLAAAIVREDRARDCRCYFEVENRTSAGRVLDPFELAGSNLFERTEADRHIDAMEDALPELVAAAASFVLTGKAGTIQRLRQCLKWHGVPVQRIVTKAYWAPGKVGLD